MTLRVRYYIISLEGNFYKRWGEIMTKKSREDITLETLYELKDLIEDAIDEVEKAESKGTESMIDKIEDCLVDLNSKTRNIYSAMISDHLSTMESNEMIESKKASTSKRG